MSGTPGRNTWVTGFNKLQAKRRDAGLCTSCGQAAMRCNLRGLPVNRRMAEGRGLPSEYDRATRGRWKPGDPPPTLERLTHQRLCEKCNDKRETKAEERRSEKNYREDARQQRVRRLRNRYTERIRAGLCGRCGNEPQSAKQNTVESDECRRRRVARAEQSPRAGEVRHRLQAGETHSSIRKTTGISETIISAIAFVLRQESAGGEQRTTTETAKPHERRQRRRTKTGP